MPKTQPNPNNPWFGIPSEVSSGFTSAQQATDYWNNQAPATQPATQPVVQPTATQPPAGATYIDDPAKLSGLREDQIWRDPSSDRIYAQQQATLVSPSGQKRVVSVGSESANNLLKSGWNLGGQVGTDVVDTQTLTPEQPLNLGDGTTQPNSFASDTALGGIKAGVKTVDENLALLTPDKESDLSAQVQQMLGGLDPESLTGRGAAQLTAEEARGIEQKNQVISSKNTALKQKVAEIDALTSSYQLANQTEEGRPQTLSRLQGAQAQNYKMYLAQKNALTAEASYMQAEVLGLQGEVQAAQAAADRAVELEYSDRLDNYNAKINQLNILLPQLEKEETKYATAVQMTLQQQADVLADEKELKKELQNVKLQAISAGITDADILSQIGNATSLDAATQLLGTNIPAPIISGGGGGGIGTTIPQVEVPTFEEYIAAKEQSNTITVGGQEISAPMTIANPEQYRDEYEASIASNALDIAQTVGQIRQLSDIEEVQAKNLAVELFGVRAGTAEENVQPIRALISQGKTIDEVQDIIRYGAQSDVLQGEWRNAIESATASLPEARMTNAIESFERRLESGDEKGAKDFLVKTAIDSLGVDEAKTARGTQRTLEFLQEIQGDLQRYENMGGNTNIFTGNIEKLAGKAGSVKDAELRTIATKIAKSIQTYRRAMSGVAFSVPESNEYKSIFPNIDKTSKFNTAVITGLSEILQGDLDYILSNRMGSDAYSTLFKNSSSNFSGVTSNGIKYTVE